MPLGFVGRKHELEALEGRLGEAARGNGAFTIVSGEAGIGKTRLADELSRRAEASEWTVVWGRSFEGVGTPPYWPWLQVLRALRSLVPASFDEALATSGELSSLLATRATTPAAADPEQARFRLFDAVLALLRSISQPRPLLIVLDDLHAADLASQLLLRFVASNIRGARIFLLATARDVWTNEDTFARVAREASQVALGRLGPEDLARWVGPELASKVDALYATSEGNPLFVHELLASAQKHPDAAWTWAQMPLGIREAVRGHLARLPEATLRVLEVGAVLGRDFSPALVRALVAAEDTEAHVERAIAAGVVVDLGAGRVRFSHGLLRDELYARLGPQRTEIHRAIATHADSDLQLAAQHGLLGARPEDAEPTARLVLAAMRDARGRLAFEDAAALGKRALAVIGPHLPPGDAARVWLSLAEARADEDPAACERAAELAELAGDAELLGRVALLAATELTMNRRDGVIALLRRGLAAQAKADTPLRAELMARLSLAVFPPPPHEMEEHTTLANEALAMARRLGDPPTLFVVLRYTTAAFPEKVDAVEHARVNGESIALAKRLGKVATVAGLFAPQVACHLELGDRDGAGRAADAAEELLSRLSQPYYQWRAPLIRGLLAAVDGRFAEADAEGRAALKIAQDGGIEEGVTMFCIQRIGNHYVRGDGDGWGEFEELATRMLKRNPLQFLFRAMPDALSGRRDEVREALHKLRGLDPSTIPGIYALAWAAIHAGVTDHAQLFYDDFVVRHARSNMLFGPGSLLTMGPAGLLLGHLAAALKRKDEARAQYERGLAFAHRIRSQPYVAHAELGLAELLAQDSAAEARVHADAARSLAEDLGMRAIATRARALSSPTTRSTAAGDALSLTREGEMWRLAARGETILLKDTKGLSYLGSLVSMPHREIHALELAGREDDGDAGPLLDARAKQAYRERAESLRDQLEEATRHGDLGRAERAREELDALAGELARAVGLGGRDRRAGSAAERARVNVQRRLRDVIKRVGELDSSMGEHLQASVKTGLFCIYAPTWPS